MDSVKPAKLDLRFKCPKCGSSNWGTVGNRGICNGPDEHGGCGFTWLRKNDASYFTEPMYMNYPKKKGGLKWTISRLYDLGVRVDKPTPIEVPCFAMDVDRGCSAWGMSVLPSGGKIAYALDDEGHSVLPQLDNAEVQGFYADGLRVCGFSHETMKNIVRKFYCEWFVLYPKARE